MTTDLRNTVDARLAEAEKKLADFLLELASNEGLKIEKRQLARFEPVPVMEESSKLFG